MGKPVRVRLPARAMATLRNIARAAETVTRIGEPWSSREDEIMPGKEHRGFGTHIAAKWRAIGTGVIGIALGPPCMALQCPVNVAGPTTGATVTLANDIQLIFNELCIGYHVAGGSAGSRELAGGRSTCDRIAHDGIGVSRPRCP